MIRLELPWPAKELLPNYRGHWSKRAIQTKLARRYAWALAQAGSAGSYYRSEDAEIVLHYEFTPPAGPGRPRDEDAVMSGCKAYRDGIADALGVNDARFRNERPVWLGKHGVGKVVISF